MSEIQSTVEESGPVARTLKVSVSAAHVRGGFETAYRKLQGRAQIKGFRKGKAPRPMLEKVYGPEVERDVLSGLIEEGCAHAIREHKLDIVSAPRLLSHEYAGAQGELTFAASVEVRPDVKLGQYRDLPAERVVAVVDDTQVDAALEGLRERMAVLKVEEGRDTVEKGDVILFSMYAFDGEEPLAEMSGEGLMLEVGSGRFPEEFEAQVVGVRRGEKTPVTVSFSSEHGDEKLRGRTIRFDVTVSEIKVKVLPPLDDDLAAESGIEGCDTLDALREKVRQDLRARARRDADRRMQNALVGRLVEAHDFEVPESLLHETIHRHMHEMGAEVAHDSEESLKLHEALAPRARAELKAGFILDAIALAEDLEVTREDLENRVRAHLASAGRRVEEVRRHYSQPGALAELRRNLLREKAAQCVFDNASVQEREVDESKVADHG